MSRYDFSGRLDGVSVSIGWDRPLGTFFVQVKQTGDADDAVLLWLGTYPGEISSAAEAIRFATDHAELPADLGSILETDRLKTLGMIDGPAQRAAKDFIVRSGLG
ncbi:hypothetical protein QUC32_29260 (plasmid) [Novosphingobium resinovorum]|jgi:hypothetical protein|uniref:Uncharacterized protein n=1 Tax=Novosphingobium resinovorum TaxID=158500 RepID=A0A1D8AFG1_9SPHN|nr:MULTISPECIES: hypothetical protein [Sphingomonadaceae]AOR80848.1 hypothetical protein BES08_29045 [Novosphingobium resinovorum]EJU13853.1 hypothetical protein LH128_06642 [Sphingomonas sp. LH128]MBF7015071.1 hypothetical protein [Novosphingobium sp. HR1a]WJM29754.1 hypothetical protein QUC32_29260 [Novosphingobium resinovorum]